MKFSLALSTFVVATTLPTSVNAVVGSDGICRADNCDDSSTECVFTSNVKAAAGELGYYTFDECGDITNPTLGMEMGRTYRFKQVSTYIHTRVYVHIHTLSWKALLSL